MAKQYSDGYPGSGKGGGNVQGEGTKFTNRGPKTSGKCDSVANKAAAAGNKPMGVTYETPSNSGAKKGR